MKIKEIMTKKVITVSPEDNILKVLKILSRNSISGVPVLENDKLVGIVTESDIIAKLDSRIQKIHFASSPDFLLIMAGIGSGMDEIEREMKIMKKFRVEDFMKRDVFTAHPDDSVTEAARIMHKKKVNRIPVLDSKGKLVGIIARQDLVNALAKF